MANSPDNPIKHDVPLEPSLTRVRQELMYRGSRDFPPDLWMRIQSLFERIVESHDHAAILAGEPDSEVAEEAGRLFRNHIQAVEAGFLDQPITLIRELALEASKDFPRFSAGEVLGSRFYVERLLGTGGMGEVYLAHDQLLNEWVAVKTVRNNLASDLTIRRRFFAEVLNARRVTHRNVCRIFDLFESGDTPFFSMEYLEGIRLTEWLQRERSQAGARQVALELAEGLDAAHRNGILHCDFKPANVIITGESKSPRPVITDFGLARAFSDPQSANRHSLQAGTLEYMAPELLAGSVASVQSDIYAFGIVLAALLPGHRLAKWCTRENAAARPVALGPVIRALRGGVTRRNLLIAAAAAPFAGLASYEFFNRRPRFAVGSRIRLVFNGFRPPENANALLFRDLLITAIRQSLLIAVVPDGRVRSTLTKLQFPATLPASRDHLLAAAARDGVSMVVEGTIDASGEGLRFVLQVIQLGDEKAALRFGGDVTDANRIVELAGHAAAQLLWEFGESDASIKAARLDQLTSQSAKAVEYYFRGLRLYENAEADAALEWFNKAVEADPQFALAHLGCGLVYAARFKFDSAIKAYKQASQLSYRIPERERLWIESQYRNITTNYFGSLETLRRLVALYPDEAIFQRQIGFAYAMNGRPLDALPYNRRAYELDPSSDNNASELIVNHAQANLSDQALSIYEDLRASGNSSTLLDFGAGLAWMGKGEYKAARDSFKRMGMDARRDRWSRVVRCAPWIMEGKFADAAATLEADLAWDLATGEQNHRLTRRIWLGYLEWLMDAPARALIQAQELVRSDPSPAYIQEIRQGVLLALELAQAALAEEGLDRLRKIETDWPSTHSKALRSHVEGAIAGGQMGGALLNQSIGLWPDPPIRYARAQWLAQNGDTAAALDGFESLGEAQGWIFKHWHWFPGLVVFGWIGQARCLVRLSRLEEARRVYDRINKNWLYNSRDYGFLRQLREEIKSIPHSAKGEKHG
jgi:tetratricopeptide (TPR) repeat protein